ncbi:MAG: hypothetical protein ACKPIF_29190 [Microcystis panniformis]
MPHILAYILWTMLIFNIKAAVERRGFRPKISDDGSAVGIVSDAAIPT